MGSKYVDMIRNQLDAKERYEFALYMKGYMKSLDDIPNFKITKRTKELLRRGEDDGLTDGDFLYYNNMI